MQRSRASVGHTVPSRSSSSSRWSSAPRCEQRQRLARVVLVDAREREADVDQHPVADLDRRRRLVHERDADLPADARDVHLREARVAVDELDHLSGDAEAHYEAPSVAAATTA